MCTSLSRTLDNVNVRCLVETMQKTVEVLQLALIDKVDDVPVVQVVVGISWKVLQIQFIARVSGSSSLQRDGFLLHGYGGGEGFFLGFFRIFRAPLGCAGVERQFFGALDGEEFSVVEGSPCQLAQGFVDTHISSLQPVSETTTTTPAMAVPLVVGAGAQWPARS